MGKRGGVIVGMEKLIVAGSRHVALPHSRHKRFNGG